MEYRVFLNAIRRTSSYWADIIHNDPSFWTVLNCSDRVDLVETALERSKGLPLQIFFPCTDVPMSTGGMAAGGPNVRESPDHNGFLELLAKHVPPRSISQLRLKPYEDNWIHLAQLIATPAPALSILTIGQEGGFFTSESSFNMRDLYLCAGVVPNLQVLELACCALPATYPPLPNLITCAIKQCSLNRGDLIHLIVAAPTLKTLTVMSCTATEPDRTSPPTTTLHTRIQDLCMDGNTFDRWTGATGLNSVLDYFQAPELEHFNVAMDYADEVTTISEWISTFSEARRHEISTLRIWLGQGIRGASHFTFMEFEPNFRIGIPYGWGDGPLDFTILRLVNAIHPAAYPSITVLDLNLSETVLDDVLPTLASKLTATTELIVYCDAPQSWLFLGQKLDDGGERPFPLLTSLRINESWLTGGAERPLLDLLQARKEMGGLQTIHVNQGEICQAFFNVAEELGIIVQTLETRAKVAGLEDMGDNEGGSS